MAVVPEEIASRLRSFSFAIPDSDVYEIDDEEHGRPREAHCTVKYGIHTSDPDELSELLSEQDMVQAVLRGVTVFDNDDCVVLKVDVESPDLARINKLISSSLKCTDTFPDYKPHITLAYLKHRAEEPKYYRKFLCGMFDGTEVWFDRFRFSTSVGDSAWIGLNGSFGAGQSRAARASRIARRIYEH